MTRCSKPSSPRSCRFSRRSSSDALLARKSQLTQRTTVVLSFVLALGFASGCARVVLVPESSPIRLAAPTTTKVYALVNSEWTRSTNSVVIPEGWYCVPPSFVEDER